MMEESNDKLPPFLADARRKEEFEELRKEIEREEVVLDEMDKVCEDMDRMERVFRVFETFVQIKGAVKNRLILQDRLLTLWLVLLVCALFATCVFFATREAKNKHVAIYERNILVTKASMRSADFIAVGENLPSFEVGTSSGGVFVMCPGDSGWYHFLVGVSGLKWEDKRLDREEERDPAVPPYVEVSVDVVLHSAKNQEDGRSHSVNALESSWIWKHPGLGEISGVSSFSAYLDGSAKKDACYAVRVRVAYVVTATSSPSVPWTQDVFSLRTNDMGVRLTGTLLDTF